MVGELIDMIEVAGQLPDAVTVNPETMADIIRELSSSCRYGCSCPDEGFNAIGLYTRRGVVPIHICRDQPYRYRFVYDLNGLQRAILRVTVSDQGCERSEG